MTEIFALMNSLATYPDIGGFMPGLLVACALVALVLAGLFTAQLWRAGANAEQWKALQTILTIPSPVERRAQLQQHMSGIDQLLLDVVLSTPVGTVRQNLLLTTLERKRAEFGSVFYRLCQLALLCPMLGLLLTLVNAGNDPEFSSTLFANSTSDLLLPFWFASVIASPALLMLTLTRLWLKSYFAELEKHTRQFSQLPAGQ